jgi:hypothetical protein
MSEPVDELLEAMIRDGVISGYERRNTRQMVVTRDGRLYALSVRILNQLVAQDVAAARDWVVAETSVD